VIPTTPAKSSPNMSVNIAQYERVHAQMKGAAINVAETLVKYVVEANPCNDSTVFINKKDLDVPKEHMIAILQITDAIMYSSGYYCSSAVKTQKNGMLSIQHKVAIMTAEDKARLLSPPQSDTETESDPEPVFTDSELARK